MNDLPLNNEFDRSPNNLDAFWMPYTWNRKFKKEPLLLTSAKGMHYTTIEGNQVLDGTAGLWCCNAGHGCDRITRAVQETVAKLDFAPTFQLGHPLAFELASRVTSMLDGYDHMFFTNSGSEAVDSALKIALAYHRARGEGHRTRLIGRERGYHGTGFGGISVGGIVKNRNVFGTMLAGVDHMRHTHDLEKQAYTVGQPEWGAHLAEDLERICALHDPSTIAAVIVEPMAGSTGVLMPPKGYLEKLREISEKHGILLIFDEVITGFGRLGTPFAVDKFGVKPDLITCAKGLTNGTIPMGGVICREGIYKAFEDAADNDPSSSIELFHGYTYSGHPVAAAAGLATLETYKEEGLFERAQKLEEYWGNAAHNLKGTRHVIDIRNMGLIGAIELESRPGEVGKRAYEAFRKCFEKGVLIRVTGDIIALSPPLIIEKGQIDQIFETIQTVLNDLD
ncbi:omega amino acid--pyruvate aminotransferase [Kiloniella spongiae]|uniref:Omega amino acid--pyruvate aminotransferase n=1 Tax=Kiloniella spongiae TaxID=1489064 RepID=A0A0H2MQJ4_9PROT|nr:aspartate aminotransferase family protein [Kiloniella spongiae]KLN58935.1 omega amino acid--pyruvate aminotransferase [Kiloniella spongiae]